MTIDGSSVNAKGDYHGICAYGYDVAIKSGTLNATGGRSFGIYVSGGFVRIDDNIISVTATGSDKGISGPVTNSIEGSGWTDKEGITGKETIEIEKDGQILSKYKKVQFPKVLDPAKVNTPPAAKELTYNGSAQDLVTAGTATGGTMQYALGADAATVPTTGWSASVPTATDEGTYYVWYKVVGDGNHEGSEPACVKAIVSRLAPYIDEVQKVVNMILALPESKAVGAKDEEVVTAARDAYEKLTDAQKAKVPEGLLERLTAAEEALAQAEKGVVATVTVNVKKASAKAVKAAAAKAGASAGSVTTIVLGENVKKIGKGALKGFPAAKTLVVKTKMLKKATLKNSLKGSKVKTVKVQVGKKKANTAFAKKYKKIFTKKVVGKKVKVKR